MLRIFVRIGPLSSLPSKHRGGDFPPYINKQPNISQTILNNYVSHSQLAHFFYFTAQPKTKI